MPQAFGALLRDLKPDWVVLRPPEVEGIQRADAEALSKFYEPVRDFDVSRQVAQVPFLPGRTFLEGDQHFTVYHRRTPPPGDDTASRLGRQ